MLLGAGCWVFRSVLEPASSWSRRGLISSLFAQLPFSCVTRPVQTCCENVESTSRGRFSMPGTLLSPQQLRLVPLAFWFWGVSGGELKQQQSLALVPLNPTQRESPRLVQPAAVRTPRQALGSLPEADARSHLS